MLVISAEQFSRLEQRRREAFFRRLRSDVLAFMRQIEPTIPPEQVTVRLDRALAEADRRGMVTEQQLVRYAYLLASFPVDFATHADYGWLAAVLESPVPADERLDSITAALTSGQRA